MTAKAKANPSKAKASQSAPSASALLAVKSRDPRYLIPAGAPRAEVSRGVTVTRGASVRGEIPSLVILDGSTESGMSLAAVARAIADGVIKRAEIEALWNQS